MEGGNLLASFNLTERQAAFVRHYCGGCSGADAVRLAGYTGASPSQESYRLLQTPSVVAAIHFEVKRRFSALAPIAQKTLENLATDENMQPKIRLDAAKTLLDRAGHISPRAAAASNGIDLPLHELSVSDLRSLADKLEGELATRAKQVSAPAAPVTDSQAIDMLD